MIERDDSGYILKILSHSPSRPWWRITDELAEGLNGYRETPGPISRVGVFTGKFGLGSLENPKTVGAGLADVGITNPPVNARMATEGRGLFSVGVGELRAIARFPEPDYIPKGRLKGVERDLLTLSFGGWLLFCRADLPDEIAYLLARTSMERRERIAAPYKDLAPHLRDLEVPITPEHLCTECVVPLHPGAERYHKEFGCL